MNPSEMPSAVLKAEHQIILRVLAVLQHLINRSESGTFEHEPLRACVDFFRHFADACHHAKEEDLLFPALESNGIPRENGPIGMMLYEHTLARGFTKEMGDSLDAFDAGDASAQSTFSIAAKKYIELMTNHIFKEDNVLFNMGDQVLKSEDQTALCSKFCEVGCRSFGGKKREEFEKIADELEARWSD